LNAEIRARVKRNGRVGREGEKLNTGGAPQISSLSLEIAHGKGAGRKKKSPNEAGPCTAAPPTHAVVKSQ